MRLKRSYAKLLLVLALVLAIAKRSYAKIVALVPGRAKKIYARIPLTRGKKTYAKILLMLNISLLLLAIAILAITLGIPSGSTVHFYRQPTPGNTTEPTSSPDSLPIQQEPPASSGTGSNIIVELSPSGNSGQQPASVLKLVVYDGDPSGDQFKELSVIDWSVDGPIMAGQSRNSSRMYFRNEGNVPVTLYFSSQAWSFKDYRDNVLEPDYLQYFSLTWDYDGAVLIVNQVKPVIFTLTVRPDIVDVATFSFNLVVTLSY